MKFAMVSVLLVLAFVGFSYQAQTKLTVYYESLCPDSRRFIINQLYPVLNQLGGVNNTYFQPEFVPYGKASTKFENGTFSFTCQHGNNECLGNKQQACVLAKLSKDKSAAMINCMMTSFDAPNDAESCADELSIDYSPVAACYNSWEGDTLLAAHGIKTHDYNPNLYYVPWITFDDVWNLAEMTASEADLLGFLCKKLSAENRPSQCQ